MRNTTKPLIFSCLIGCTLLLNVKAQKNDYDLNKYFTPDIIRRSLDLDANASGNASHETYKWQYKDTTNSNSLNASIKSAFTVIQSTRKKESELQVILNLSGNINNTNKKPIDYYNPDKHSSNSDEHLLVNYKKKVYGLNKSFFSLGISGEVNTNFHNNKVDSIYTTNKSNNKNFSSGVYPSIGFGKGRIESVTDARQAIYILDELSKKNALTRQLSKDEIFKFSQLISRVKNKRFLDARLHKIDEISAVDSFLVSNNLINKVDAIYFTSLYDNWENGANFTRTSGQSFETSLTPGINWISQRNELEQSQNSITSSTWNKTENTRYVAILDFSYNYAKQINLNWEKTLNLSLSGVYLKNYYNYSSKNAANIDQNDEQERINLNGTYCVSFYPNTRTHLSTSLSQTFQKTFYETSLASTDETRIFYSITAINFSAVYYVSSQLSISGNASIGNDYIKTSYTSPDIKQNQLTGGFSASLKYSFF